MDFVWRTVWKMNPSSFECCHLHIWPHTHISVNTRKHTDTHSNVSNIYIRPSKQSPVLGNHAIPVQMAGSDHVYFTLI